ncbi:MULTISPECIES: hypothetical protein [Bradyrhizobium]|uniref:hypothetical protein n=1 Tax=Bradyrhizobium TaxID=374 RepID=UPI00211DFFC0|nr:MULTISPECIES: hypothetical protein [Bradyrhizobium]
MPSRAEVIRVLLHLLNETAHGEIDEITSQILEGARHISAQRLSEIDQKLDSIIRRLDRPFCQLAETEDNAHAKLIVGLGSGARQQALAHLNDSLGGARHLTICDPYLLSSPGRISSEEYVNGIESALPQTLRAVEIFSKRGVRNKDIADRLNQMFRRRDIRVRIYKTEDIHDRVWIKDSLEAYSIGTSFNGLGNKFTFILPLPSSDVRPFLSEIQILRSELSFSKSV